MKKYITVYDKYVFSQVLVTTLVAILLFVVVWMAPEELLNTIKHVLQGDYTPRNGFLGLFYELPKILGKAFPVGLLLGTLFTFDKLSKDSELTIFRAVGMPFFFFLRPVLVLSFIVTYLCFITYDKLIPYSCQKLVTIKEKNLVSQFIYAQKDEKGRPDHAYVVSRFAKGAMQDVIILDFSNKVFKDLHGLENVQVAKTGVKTKNENGESCWKLKDITSYNIDEEGIFRAVSHTDEMTVLDGKTAEDAYLLMLNSTKKERDLTNKSLKKYVNLLKKENFDEEYRLMYNKYLQRYLHPFVCVLLAILGCLLGFSKPREQKLIGFTIAIGCIFLYYITLPFFDLMAEKGILPPLLTAMLPPSAFLGAIVAFYKTRDL